MEHRSRKRPTDGEERTPSVHSSSSTIQSDTSNGLVNKPKVGPLSNFPQWEKLHKELQENLWDLKKWDELISVLETLVANNLKSLSFEVKELIRQEFDTLLTKFPLLTNFWKRYVTVEYSLNGLRPSVKILERAVNAFPNSLELWCDYVSIITSNELETSENIKGLFDEAVSKVGRHFLSDQIWDLYLEWQNNETGENSNEYLQILLKIIELPLHQYARYFAKFEEIRPKFTTTDLIDENLLEKLAVDQFGDGSKFEELSVEQITILTDSHFNDIFNRTQLGTNLRWKYESELTRQQFELLPVDPQEINKWVNYIDFEIEQNLDKEQIKSVFQRALIPTCFYDKIWIKYLLWMIHREDIVEEDIIYTFNRVCDIFIPIDQPKIRFFYASYLYQKLNKFEASKKIYMEVITNLPRNCEAVTRLFQLLVEEKGKELSVKNASLLVNSYIEETNKQKQIVADNRKRQKLNTSKEVDPSVLDEDFLGLLKVINEYTVGQIIVEICKIYWLQEKDLKKTRALLIKYFKEDIVKRSVSYWTFFVKFELSQKNIKNLSNIKNYIQLYSKLPIHTINEILDLFTETQFKTTSLSELTKTQRETIRTWLETDKESSLSMKHYLKARQDPDLNEEVTDKRLFKENGHPGIIVETRPRITNLIDVESNLEEIVYPLPQFKNVEKASALPQYNKENN